MDEEAVALQERLRAKYAGIVAANQQQEAMTAGVDEAAIAAHAAADDKRRLEAMQQPAGTTSQVEVRLCPLCQGQGRIKEYYGHREMTKHCEHCDGDGTLTHGARKPATDVPVRHTAAAGLDNRGSKEQRARVKCEVAIAKLQTQVFAYEQERRDTEQRLAQTEQHSQPLPEEEADAARALLAQLDLFLEQLHVKLQAKQQQHQTLVAACAATIGGSSS